MVSDILSELGQSFPHVISHILSYLEPEELCILSCVSQSTRDFIVNDPNAKRRRESHLKALQELKQEVGHENWPIKKTTPEVKSENRIALNEVKNTQPTANRNEVSAAEVEVSCIRMENNANISVSTTSPNSSVNSNANSTVNTTANSSANSITNSIITSSANTSGNSSISSIMNSSINSTISTTANITTNSIAIKPTPEGRKLKRRRVDFTGNVYHIISSTPKMIECRRGSTNNETEQDSGYFEETKNKVKSKSRKCEPTAGSKASRRQLKRL